MPFIIKARRMVPIEEHVVLDAILDLPTAPRKRHNLRLTCDCCGQQIEDARFIGGFAKGHQNLILHKACVTEDSMIEDLIDRHVSQPDQPEICPECHTPMTTCDCEKSFDDCGICDTSIMACDCMKPNAEMRQLREQRDALLAACKEVMRYLENPSVEYAVRMAPLVKRAILIAEGESK